MIRKGAEPWKEDVAHTVSQPPLVVGVGVKSLGFTPTRNCLSGAYSTIGVGKLTELTESSVYSEKEG